ncbi:hypothetical protein V2G26_007678 [Clonostachys chloroleuca]
MVRTKKRAIRKVKRAIKDKKRDNDEEAENEDVSAQEFSDDQDAAEGDGLPGLVWPKRDHDCCDISCRGWFFMYPDADIQCRGAAGEARDVYLVTFDPILQEWAEDEDRKFDPMEHPLRSEKMKARDEYYESGLFGWMGMRKIGSHWEQEADIATCKALELGWESW